MDHTGVYVPIDRLQALAAGSPLPDRAYGAALFADISGFTQLTEWLVRELGPDRGAEELTRHLNAVYDALIAELYRYRGSVISFSGDAITCWFDDPGGGRRAAEAPSLAAQRAAACALAMQRQMARFASIATPNDQIVALAMKASVATGPARRFVVGDPQIQLVDVLAGALLERLSAGEHLARRGEVLIDAPTAAALDGKGRVGEQRADPAGGQGFWLLEELAAPAEPDPWPEVALDTLPAEDLRPWLLPHVYERLRAGQGEFLAELRPAVVLFLRFGGIDYDGDDAAGARLDAFIRGVQGVLTSYGGTLLQITIGDKGSSLYAAFGAPQAHEDDPTRAVSAALALRGAWLEGGDMLQIGVSQGRMRTGAYGAELRRTYGVIGDAVNLAARLMEAARPGQILASASIRAAADGFVWENLPDISVKGKNLPIKVAAPLGVRGRRTLRLQDARYGLPMVGRRAELGLVQTRVEQALAGSGQIVGICAEAGMGKSRLVAEVIRLAQGRGMIGYGGACESYGTTTSYQVWHTIWQGFYDIDPEHVAAGLGEALAGSLASVDPALVERMPLLGAALNLALPESELTASLDAKLRKASLESLLVDCVRARASQDPILFVLEDCHWLDPLSHDLLETIGRAIESLPVLVVLAYRPPLETERVAPRSLAVAGLPYFSQIDLRDFTAEEARELIGLKLTQAYGADAAIPPAFAERVMARSQGNPFYVEELLNYLKDCGIDPQNSAALQQIDLPSSLHTLILSRIDQLSESQKVTLKIASVIGRLFRAAILWDVYPQRGDGQHIRTDLEVLSRLELTLLDAEPELTYLFRHIVTQQVAYESVPYAMRALLHGQIGLAIEQHGVIDQFIDLLAFHYGRSTNLAKQREYFIRAGAAARADYANQAAIEYYERALPLLETHERGEITRRLAQVLELVSRWDAAAERYRQALELAEQHADRQEQGWCQTAIGELLRKRGRYAEAAEWHERALASFEAVGEQAGVAQVLHYRGTLAAQQGQHDAARALYQQSLAIRRALDDKPSIGSLLSNLGIVARFQGDLPTARALHEEGLAIRREVGNRWAIANSLNNLGNVLLDQGDYPAARTRLEEAVELLRQIGDRWAIANSLNNLGNVARTQHDLDAAWLLYHESLLIVRDLGDRWALAYLLEDIGGLAALEGGAARAVRLIGAAAALREAIGSPLSASERARLEQLIAPARALLDAGSQAELDAAGRALTMSEAIEEALAR